MMLVDIDDDVFCEVNVGVSKIQVIGSLILGYYTFYVAGIFANGLRSGLCAVESPKFAYWRALLKVNWLGERTLISSLSSVDMMM